MQHPTGVSSVDEFAVLIDNVPNLVFSHTLKTVSWKNTRLVNGDMKEEVTQLKQQPGKNLLVGSPSLIAGMMQWGLIDEFRFCVQPIVLGKGLPLFKNIAERIDLKSLKATPHLSSAIPLFYEPVSPACKS
ncbi:dihydrofolate reductase family protein [Terrimonas pollutisoli]|uniref:dihydrofolate reductase family protein n=1 Tax=Terrimonas pollutisoli TaxID=3034147 RepID=UPI0023EBA663|nr:dihydrofolate reductase family protein [Terrimonas sp. H1YJ31]